MSAKDPDLFSNASDFDNSDDDLADLLNDDDDDDRFSKKGFRESPLKLAGSAESPQKTKGESSKLLSSPKRNAESPHKTTSKGLNSTLPDENFDASNILNDFDETKSSTVTSETARENSIFDDKSGILSNLSSKENDDTSEENFRKTSIDDDDGDILSQLDKINKSKPAAPKERRDSFLDQFLQNVSPKHESKKSDNVVPEKQTKTIETKDDDDDDILGAYVPTAVKKNESTSGGGPLKKKGILAKQVSFKDLHEEFTESKLPEETDSVSPKRIVNTKTSVNIKTPVNKNASVHRSEKMGASKNEDMDWSNFLNEFPEKPKSAEESKALKSNISSSESVNNTKRRLSLRRQSSGAEWLGLNELDISNDSTKSKLDNDDITFDLSSKATRPKTVSTSEHKPRRRDMNKSIEDDWFSEVSGKEKSDTKSSDITNIFKKPITNDSMPSSVHDIETVHKLDSSALSFTSNPSFEDNKLDSGTLSLTLNPSFEDKSKPFKDTNIEFSKQITSEKFKDLAVTSPKDYSFTPKETSNASMQIPDQSAYIYHLQLLINNSMQEQNKLMKENELSKTMYEAKIKMMEEQLKNQKRTSEDSLNTIEINMKNEYELKIKSLEERINLLVNEKVNQERNIKEKCEILLKEHQSEIKKLKEFYGHSIDLMKEDHEEALNRLKRLKDQELEAILSTQVHTKSLQQLSEQLEARASELAVLQSKVEERNQFSIKEKQALLDAKEKELKVLQDRLQRELQESNEEKIRLQQLILRLESRLQKMTTEAEEEHWEVQQMKSKLAVQQKYLEEEQKLNHLQIEKEKEKLHLSQESILHEQKTVLLQLAQERQQLTQEKIELQSFARSLKEEEAKLNVKKIREDSVYQSQKQYFEEDKVKLHFEKEKLKQEEFQLERQRNDIMREKQEIQREREKLHEMEIHIKRKSNELEEMALTAAREKEQGRVEHSAALKLKSEHHMKMKQYAEQMQALMDKEREILREKEELISERLAFEQTKNTTQCIKCKVASERPVQAPPLHIPTNASVSPQLNRNGISNIPQNLMDPSLIVWYITGQKDREFLQQELTFLKSLKDAEKTKYK